MKARRFSLNRRTTCMRRRAAAVVELAVVTPLLLTMLFGIMEFGRVFMASETLNTAAREACRVGILQGSTTADVQQRFMESVAPLGKAVTVDMLTVQEVVPEGQTYTVVNVTVTVPYENVSLFGDMLGLKRTTLSATCSMRKEGT